MEMEKFLSVLLLVSAVLNLIFGVVNLFTLYQLQREISLLSILIGAISISAGIVLLVTICIVWIFLPNE